MITFVDTNILLDVFLPDPDFGERSAAFLEKAFDEGSLVIDHLVYAELAPQFSNRDMLDETLSKLGVRIIPIDQNVAYKAGKSWQKYRKAGGKRNRILSDFLIGAHAQEQAERLLTRDRGFYRKYFKKLTIVF